MTVRKAPVRERSSADPVSGDRSSDVLPRDDESISIRSGQRVHLTEETSSARARVPDAVPASWIDRLLCAVIDLPVAAGEHAVVEAVVEAVAAILPSHAVGVCYVPEHAEDPREQIVVKRVPDGAPSAGGIDPTRVFPWMEREHVVPVAGTTTGSTLHVASMVDGFERGSSPAVHLLERAAMALGAALDQARTIASLTRAQRDMQLLQDRMVQADKLATFGQIAAGVVHELNNPLTSIVAYSDYLIRQAVQRRLPAEEGDVERLRRISESANRMLRFTRDLVSYTRPSTGLASPVVVHAVLDQAIAFCEHVLAASSVRVERRYGVGVLTVRAVGEQLVQVFVNLLTNASQAASPQGGKVVVSTSLQAEGRQVVVVVEDDGAGIAPQHLAQVFAPFFTTKGAQHGTGLGLSIVKSIVESHDGRIRVESELGRGTRFVVELPAHPRG